MADDFTVVNYQPLDILYRDGVKYQTIKSFYNNQEVDRIYQGNFLIYQKRWLGEVVLPDFNDTYEVVELDPPLHHDAINLICDYDLELNHAPGCSGLANTEENYPIENFLNMGAYNYIMRETALDNVKYNNVIYNNYISYEIFYQPVNNIGNRILFKLVNEWDQNTRNVPISEKIWFMGYHYEMSVGGDRIINSISDPRIPTLDDINQPVTYNWVNNIYVDNEHNIEVSVLGVWGNHKELEEHYRWNEQTQEYDYYTEENIMPNHVIASFFYCENSQSLYYNQNMINDCFGYGDFSEGPKYDYVRNINEYFRFPNNTLYINVNFNSLTQMNFINFRKMFEQTQGTLKRPINIPAIRDISNYWQSFSNFQKPICGRYVTNLRGTYFTCHNLTGKAACGDNVVDMSSAYFYCSNLTKANCGRNVVNMMGAFQQCINLTGKAACGDNVVDLSYTYYSCDNLALPNIGLNVKNAYYAYAYCNNLRKLEFIPSIEDYRGMYYSPSHHLVEEIYINRNDMNYDFDMAVYSNVRFPNLRKITIEGNENFISLRNAYNTNIYLSTGACNFRSTYNLEELYISNNFKDMSGMFQESGYYQTLSNSLLNLRVWEIPESIVAYRESFGNTSIQQPIHNRNGGIIFVETYYNCFKMHGELYIPETAEQIDRIAYNCTNLTSIKFNRNCKITNPFGNSYSGWEAPFTSCCNVTDIAFSDYCVNFPYTIFEQMYYRVTLAAFNRLNNIVFYNNDNNTPKILNNIFGPLVEYCNAREEGTLNIYVPDSTNANSFNKMFYTDPHNTISAWEEITWTLMENGYYNEKYKINVLTNYDYINDQYPT